MVIEVSGGVVSVGVVTVQVRVAGVGSVLPAASVAVAVKVWLPSARPVSVVPSGGQVAGALAASRAHWNVELASVEA